MAGRIRRRAALFAVVVGTTLAGTAAAAQASMTISVGKPVVSSRVSIKVPLTVTCSPFDPSLTFFGALAGVVVEQASGTRIAHGEGSVSGFLGLSTVPWACDGSNQIVFVTVVADPSGAPFHGGKALLAAGATSFAGVPCGAGCFITTTTQDVQTGWITVTMK
jgi:hypothetical protein